MARGGSRENAGRKKKSESEKKQVTRKTIVFSSSEEDSLLLEKISKYGKGKNFSDSVKEIIACELKKREESF